MNSGENCVAAVVLAGGLARRMGGQAKAFLKLGGKPLLEHVLKRLRPQADPVIISANANLEQYQRTGLPVVRDPVPGHAGPLAGILAAMLWLRQHAPQTRWLLSVAVDTPFFPHDLAARLLHAAQRSNAPLAMAASRGRAHPVFALWSTDLAPDIEKALLEEDMRQIRRFAQRLGAVQVTFPCAPVDPFFNINHPQDLHQAQQYLTALSSPPGDNTRD